MSSCSKIRKAVILQNQYVTQQACSAYIATISQTEAIFDLSFVAQVTDPKEKDIKTLNKHLHWQINHLNCGLYFDQLDIIIFKLIVFIDTLFANNFNLTSQIGYIICLTNTFNKANIIHWFSIKYKRVTRSVLALELYVMVQEFGLGIVIQLTIKEVLDIKLLLMIICTNSKLLYNCLMKLGSTQE